MKRINAALTRRGVRIAGTALLIAGALGLAQLRPARADDDHEHGQGHRAEHQAERSSGTRSAAPVLPLYQQECGSCHLAYPPGMLPAASWQRLMGRLDKHFGTDAALDEADVKTLSAWLQAHAAPAGRAATPPEDRITRSNWFVHEHDEIRADVWKRSAVRSAANCAACHTRAAEGRFGEHEVRMPR